MKLKNDLNLKKVRYKDLNSRQKENYNYQHLSALLADYGFITHRLTDDWLGADFIAQHIDGETFLKGQLKGRLTFDKKYIGKEIYIAFRSRSGDWYLYDHDHLLNYMKHKKRMIGTKSWEEKGLYSYSHLNKALKDILSTFLLV